MVQGLAEPVPDSIAWEYVSLKAIELHPGTRRSQLRLLCEDDAAGASYYVHCDDTWLFYVEPYAKLLLDSQDDLSVETPQVPVYRDSSGRLHFSLAGAECDYPYLKVAKAYSLSGVPGWSLNAAPGLIPFRKRPT